jgi:signal transduction histidine kinase
VAVSWIMPDGLGLVFGGYAAALYGDRRVRHLAGAVAVVVLVMAFGAVLVTDSAKAVGHLTGFAFGYGVAWVFGDRTRTRRAYLAELTARALRLERERDEHARRAAEEERYRIARELHDVVAHNVSVIAVQAGAARATSGANPARATDALELIERMARGTLTELRTLLGVLRRSDDAPPSRRPLPTLGQLDELVGQAREAGVHVEIRVQGAVRPLAAVVDMCAYRVVQEALTNVIKHAPHAHAHLLIHYQIRGLVITVVDDGPGARATGTAGHGLIGMRERVTLAGGRLRTGPALGGGFRVEARLPLDEPDDALAGEPADGSSGEAVDGPGAEPADALIDERALADPTVERALAEPADESVLAEPADGATAEPAPDESGVVADRPVVPAGGPAAGRAADVAVERAVP